MSIGEIETTAHAVETTVYEIALMILSRSHHNRCREEILEELDITDADADILQQVIEEYQRGRA